MPYIMIYRIKSCYFEYALYFLVISLFFGNALLSIACVALYLSLLISDQSGFRTNVIFEIKPFLFSIGYFLLNFIIVVLLANDINELISLRKLLPFLLFPTVFIKNQGKFKNENLIYNCKKLFVISASLSFFLSFFFGLYRMFFFDQSVNTIYITYNFLTDLFGVHHIYLSAFYSLAILLSLELFQNATKKNHKHIFIFTAGLLFIALILLSSRTALFGLILVLAIKVIFTKKNNLLKPLIALLSVLLISLILIFSLPTLKNRFFKLHENVSSYSGISLRAKIWDNTIDVFKESPIHGYGFKTSQQYLFSQYKKTNFRRAFLLNLNSHNQYLQVLIDSGILGLFFLITLILSYFTYNTVAFTHKLFLIFMIIMFITESFLVRQAGVIFFTLFINLLLFDNKELV